LYTVGSDGFEYGLGLKSMNCKWHPGVAYYFIKFCQRPSVCSLFQTRRHSVGDVDRLNNSYTLPCLYVI
jgi:hypothetical protein